MSQAFEKFGDMTGQKRRQSAVQKTSAMTRTGQPERADWPGGPEEQGGQFAAGADQMDWQGEPAKQIGQMASGYGEPDGKKELGEVWPALTGGQEKRAWEQLQAGWKRTYGEERGWPACWDGCAHSCVQTAAPEPPGTGSGDTCEKMAEN
jgi:hypothetical protein